jgi:DUF4097 and DUF4098 domain-containing protein YvlB
MKSASILLLLIGSLAAYGETEEHLDKQFTVKPGGKLIVDVDFGSIDVTTSPASTVKIEVFRKVKRGGKADEEAFLRDRPVTFSQDGDTITVQAHAKSKESSWRGSQSTEGKYTISVPAEFNAQVKTSGGSVTVTDLKGDVKAKTSGGNLKLTRVRGPLDGNTSGGNVRVTDCQGPLSVHTSGGNIDVENAVGKVEATTSGGHVAARLASAVSDDVILKTSGGNVTLRVPEKSAFDLDASTSGGSVNSDLPVTTTGKAKRTQLKGPVNGGGKEVVLRTSGGNIQVKKI